MYPFYWHHVCILLLVYKTIHFIKIHTFDNSTYIPILPISLNDFLQAPTPFIMGLHTDYYKEPADLTDVCHPSQKPQILILISILQIVIVDLDKGTIKMQTPPPAPPKETAALNTRLRSILTPGIIFFHF